MRRLKYFLLPFLCIATTAWAQKPRYSHSIPKAQDTADHMVQIHVTGVHLRSSCSGFGDHVVCAEMLYVDAVIDGKKIELVGKYASGSLPLGDYWARALEPGPASESTTLWKRFEVLFPDKTIWPCRVSGFSE